MSRPEPIDVFISYKREERDVAKALAEALARRGYKVWWDIELLPGDRFVDAIMAVIERAKALIVLWSRQAVASDFVRAEAREAYEEKKLIPVRLERCRIPLPFGELQTLDLEAWWPEADETRLEPLLRALDARIGRPPAPPQTPAATEANLHGQDSEATFWRSVSERQPQSAREYELYLQQYPNGVFASLARHRLEELQGPEQPSSPASGAAIARRGVAGPVGASNLLTLQSARSLPLPELARIPPVEIPLPATFIMGSTTGGYDDERPTRTVTIAQPLHMSRTPITFEHYAAFAQESGRKAPSPADFGWNDAPTTLPVVGVTWRGANAYAEWLGEQTGASCRLPSEAEWEFACRAGTTTAYWWGDDFDPTLANTREGGSGRPTPVGTYPPASNPWGLHDMSGNVWEWTLDHWHDNYRNAPTDGSAWIDTGAQEDSPRVLRGGSWYGSRDGARCAYRGRNFPYYGFGFRVVCSSPS